MFVESPPCPFCAVKSMLRPCPTAPHLMCLVHGVLPTAITSHRTPLCVYSCDVDQAGFWGPKPSPGAHPTAVWKRGALDLLLASRRDISVYSCKIG